jgi:hypothetical protein
LNTFGSTLKINKGVLRLRISAQDQEKATLEDQHTRSPKGTLRSRIKAAPRRWRITARPRAREDVLLGFTYDSVRAQHL